MKPINFSKEDLGIVCQGYLGYKDYEIEPDPALGRGGFHFRFSDYYPKNPELKRVMVRGKYNHALWPLKSSFQLEVSIWTVDLELTLIKTCKLENAFSSRDITDAVIKHIEVFKVFIQGAPASNQKYYYGDNGRYVERNGDYHFSVGPLPF